MSERLYQLTQASRAIREAFNRGDIDDETRLMMLERIQPDRKNATLELALVLCMTVMALATVGFMFAAALWG